jgi:hypothetical protein
MRHRCGLKFFVSSTGAHSNSYCKILVTLTRRVSISGNYFTVLHSDKLLFSRLGSVVVSVIATEPKGRAFKNGRSDGFLRAIKIRSTPSFVWEVKPEVPCRKILRHVKDPFRYLTY